MFDVRFLPNPYYVEKLRPLSGMDDEVQEYVLRSDVAQRFLEKLTGMIDFLLPQYAAEGRYALTIGIGCTGGQHRSVAGQGADGLSRRARRERPSAQPGLPENLSGGAPCPLQPK